MDIDSVIPFPLSIEIKISKIDSGDLSKEVKIKKKIIKTQFKVLKRS